MQVMYGTIDRASAYEVIPVLEAGFRAGEWAKVPALAASQAFISTDSLKLAPGPRKQTPAGGPWSQLARGLSPVTSAKTPTVASVRSAMRSARAWAGSKHVLRNQMSIAEADPNFGEWRDWHIRYEWLEHSIRMSGLFDLEFTKAIHRSTGISIADLDRLHAITHDSSKFRASLEHYAAGRPPLEFQELSQAWLASTLVRGRFHAALAKTSQFQLLQHPIRRPAAASTASPGGLDVLIPRSESVFAGLVLFGSRATTLDDRIAVYCENIKRISTVRKAGELRLTGDQAISVDEAVAQAVDEARRIDLTLHNPSLEKWFSAGLIGANTLASFRLKPFEAATLTTALAALEYREPLGRTVLRPIAHSNRRLNHLAWSVAGLLFDQASLDGP
jgi:hypothetical protein